MTRSKPIKAYRVTLSFMKNVGRYHGPPIFEERTRTEVFFASDAQAAINIAKRHTGCTPVKWELVTEQ